MEIALSQCDTPKNDITEAPLANEVNKSEKIYKYQSHILKNPLFIKNSLFTKTGEFIKNH